MNTRKDFLLATSLFALAPAAARAAAPAPSHPFRFDKAQFDRILAKPARHKQCFGATKIDGGSVIEGMNNTINAYEQYYGEPAGAVQTVAVLYHGGAIALAMNDEVWNRLIFPALAKAPPEVRKAFAGEKRGKGNPYLAKEVPGIVARGASFFVCHNAVVGLTGLAAKALGESFDNVHAALMAGIVPGALVVPAGVMAINACQEAKFTYIQSSL